MIYINNIISIILLFVLFATFCYGKKLNKTCINIKNYLFKLIYLQGFAPHPTSFIGIKEAKELHFLSLKYRYYFIFNTYSNIKCTFWFFDEVHTV